MFSVPSQPRENLGKGCENFRADLLSKSPKHQPQFLLGYEGTENMFYFSIIKQLNYYLYQLIIYPIQTYLQLNSKPYATTVQDIKTTSTCNLQQRKSACNMQLLHQNMHQNMHQLLDQHATCNMQRPFCSTWGPIGP